MADYQAMWKDLGMDLETHDQLCAVLPMAFGDTYLTQENRPENMAFYDFVVSEIHGVRPAELIELQKQGGKVFGTFCVFVPDEVVVACGGAVTGLCGGSQFWVPEGEKVLPSGICPLIDPAREPAQMPSPRAHVREHRHVVLRHNGQPAAQPVSSHGSPRPPLPAAPPRRRPAACAERNRARAPRAPRRWPRTGCGSRPRRSRRSTPPP